ncbi:hypothetical protein ABPG75_007129 [Micractinium tetrahymenae]
MCRLLALTLLVWAQRIQAHRLGGDVSGVDVAGFKGRQLLAEAAAGCGMTPASNDGRTFNVPQLLGYGVHPGDSGPDLLRADAAPNSTFLFLDRYEAASTRAGATQRAQDTVLIQSDTLLTKPLVLGIGATVEVAAGATLTLAAQPVLPRQRVFYGSGSVRFQAGDGALQFAVLPEWWGGGSFSDTLDLVARSCAGARCLVVLTRSYGLRRPWRLNPSLLPWSGANSELHPELGNRQGVVFASGRYDPARRVDLPRLQNFDSAVTLEDVSGLWLYMHNTKYAKAAVTLAPSAAIRDTTVEAYSVVSSNNIFTVQPKSGRPLLQDVYLRSYMLVKAAPGVSNLNWFRGCATLANVTIENSLLNGNAQNSANTLLRSDCAGGIAGLNWRVTTMNFAHPKGWSVVAGTFTNLRSYVRLGQPISSSGGTVSWAGAGNTLDWGAFSTVQKDAVQMAASPRPGSAPIVVNSNMLQLPPLTSPWPANTVRTFYAYHVMMDGSNDASTLSLGPHNQAKTPQVTRKQNPGIVVEGLLDQGGSVKYQLAIKLRNVSGRTLTQADVDGPLPIQFRLQVGVPSLLPATPGRRGAALLRRSRVRL